jgi:hypothetical protein
VQPLIPSPILPAPLSLTKTVDEPVAIGAACDGHGAPGNRCDVLLSPCLDHAILFTNTVGEPTALAGVEQCVTSASPILVAAGTFFLHKLLQSFIPYCH